MPKSQTSVASAASVPAVTRKRFGHIRQRPSAGLSLDTSGGANPTDAPGLEINSIIAQFKKHGTLPNVQLKNPLYGDFTFPEDIHSVRAACEGAEDRFLDLPSAVRTAAGNDWVRFIEMIGSEETRQDLIDAGLQIVDDKHPSQQKPVHRHADHHPTEAPDENPDDSPPNPPSQP